MLKQTLGFNVLKFKCAVLINNLMTALIKLSPIGYGINK